MKKKFITAAHAVAMTGNGVGMRSKFRLGAVLVHKNSIVSVGTNSYKTHPLMRKRTEWPFLHAEQHAIIRAGVDNCEGLDLYIARVLKNNTLALSKPCDVCAELIREVGIKRTFYSTDAGEGKYELY
jgi:deoxycytidylate deaminase